MSRSNWRSRTGRRQGRPARTDAHLSVCVAAIRRDVTDFRRAVDEFRHHRLVHQKAPRSKKMRCNACSRCPTSKASSRCAPTPARRIACAIELGMGIGGLPTYIVGARHRSHSGRYRRSASGRHLDDLSSGRAQHPSCCGLHRLAANAVRSQALSVVRRRIHSSRANLPRSQRPELTGKLLNLPIFSRSRTAKAG